MTAVDRAHHTYRSIIMYRTSDFASRHLAQVAASKGGGCCCRLPYGGVSIFGGRRHIWGSDLPQRWAGQHIHVAVRFGDLASSVQLLRQSCVMSPGPQKDIDVLGDWCGIQRRAERSRCARRHLKVSAHFGEQASGAQPLRGPWGLLFHVARAVKRYGHAERPVRHSAACRAVTLGRAASQSSGSFWRNDLGRAGAAGGSFRPTFGLLCRPQ